MRQDHLPDSILKHPLIRPKVGIYICIYVCVYRYICVYKRKKRRESKAGADQEAKEIKQLGLS